MKKAAIYVRVSTNAQAIEGTSLEGQVEMCLEKANSLNLFEVEIYREAGASGEDIDRPEMDRLRDDVAQGMISHVICVHPDRLSRDIGDKIIVCAEFEKYGVNLIFVDTDYKDTPEGQLFFHIQSSIAQYELALIKKRTSRGRIKAVEKHNKVMPMRTAPFGYDLVDAQLVVNEAEAKIVKKIYEWYVYDNLTLREIGNKLVSQGVVPKRRESKAWHQSSINRILTNEVYIGVYWYNRRKSQKLKGEKNKNGNPKKKYKIRDKSEWVKTEVPAIIEPSLFRIAQEQRNRNMTNAGNNKYEYLLKGLLRCGHCGRKWCGTTYSGRIDRDTGEKSKYRCYRCPNKNPKRYGEDIYKCNTKTIRAEVIEDYVWEIILQAITDMDAVIDTFEEASLKNSQQILDMVKAMERQIQEKEKERAKIKRMYMREVISEDEAARDLGLINQEVADLKNELKKIQDLFEDNQKNKDTNEHVKAVVGYLEKILNNEADVPFEKKRFVIQTLIDEIILTFNNDQTQCEMVCVGHLDALVDKIDIASSLQHEKI